MIEERNGPDPIFVAGGPGSYCGNDAKASICQNGNGSDWVGLSGQQSFFQNDPKNLYCAGAGFFGGEMNIRALVADSVPPESYFQAELAFFRDISFR